MDVRYNNDLPKIDNPNLTQNFDFDSKTCKSNFKEHDVQQPQSIASEAHSILSHKNLIEENGFADREVAKDDENLAQYDYKLSGFNGGSLEQCIGMGGYGTVYKATVEYDGKNFPAAVKKMSEYAGGGAVNNLARELYMNTKLCQAIFKEAKLSNQNPVEYAQDHNVVLCFSAIPFMRPNHESKVKDLQTWANLEASDIVSNPEKGFCFTFVNGTSFTRLLGNIDDLSREERIKIIKGLFVAMNTFDKAGLIHQDLTTSNIMVDNNLNVYVVDLGGSIDVNSPSLFRNPLDRSSLWGYSFYPPEIFEDFEQNYNPKDHIEHIFGAEGGKKLNAYASAMYALTIFFGSEGGSIYNNYFGTDDYYSDEYDDFESSETENCENADKLDPRCHPAELRKKYYEDIPSNVEKCNKACGDIYNKEQCEMIVYLLQKSLNPNPNERITSAQALEIIKQIENSFVSATFAS